MRSDDGSARWEFDVEELLKKLKENREIHIEEYNEAWEGYMGKLEHKLADMLKRVRDDEDIETYVKLEKPRSHEEDYDRIIEVLGMTTAETVQITLSEFDKYVRDNWDWTASFKMSNAAYSG